MSGDNWREDHDADLVALAGGEQVKVAAVEGLRGRARSGSGGSKGAGEVVGVCLCVCMCVVSTVTDEMRPSPTFTFTFILSLSLTYIHTHTHTHTQANEGSAKRNITRKGKDPERGKRQGGGHKGHWAATDDGTVTLVKGSLDKDDPNYDSAVGTHTHTHTHTHTLEEEAEASILTYPPFLLNHTHTHTHSGR
jgi:hypothetical protein